MTALFFLVTLPLFLAVMGDYNLTGFVINGTCLILTACIFILAVAFPRYFLPNRFQKRQIAFIYILPALLFLKLTLDHSPKNDGSNRLTNQVAQEQTELQKWIAETYGKFLGKAIGECLPIPAVK